MAPTGFNSLLERTQRLAGIVGQEPATCDRHGAYEAQIFRDDRRSGCPACAEVQAQLATLLGGAS